jgi:hypothetical protein
VTIPVGETQEKKAARLPQSEPARIPHARSFQGLVDEYMLGQTLRRCS